MPVFATAGTRLFIGPVLNKDTDIIAADVSALNYVEIGNTVTIGQFGDTAQSVTADEIGRGRTRKVKGTRNAGNLSVTCNTNSSDAGQQACHTAQLDNSDDFAFKIVYPDAPASGSAPVGSTRYFLGKVSSDAENAASANNFNTTVFTIDIDSNVLKIPASSGS